MIIYDCEIIRGIPPRDDKNRIPGIEYCAGWKDFKNMGISVIGVFDYLTYQYRVFCIDNWDQFQALVDTYDLLIGFNNIEFDNNLLRANGFNIPDNKCVDLLQVIWGAAGLMPPYKPRTHAGFGLAAIMQANFNETKSGRGDLAPVQWQQGKIGSVIDYCLHDVRLTKRLYDHINMAEWIRHPKTLEYLQIKQRELKITKT